MTRRWTTESWVVWSKRCSVVHMAGDKRVHLDITTSTPDPENKRELEAMDDGRGFETPKGEQRATDETLDEIDEQAARPNRSWPDPKIADSKETVEVRNSADQNWVAGRWLPPAIVAGSGSAGIDITDVENRLASIENTLLSIEDTLAQPVVLDTRNTLRYAWPELLLAAVMLTTLAVTVGIWIAGTR